MILINANGDQITSDFISGSFDSQKVKEIVSKDTTPLPAGFRKLWFNVYGGFVYITNLTGVTLNKYEI